MLSFMRPSSIVSALFFYFSSITMMDNILKYFQLDFKVYFVLLKDTKKAFDDFKNKNE